MKEKWVLKIFFCYVIAVFAYLVLGELFLPADDFGADRQVSEFQQQWYRIMEDGMKVAQDIPGICDVERGKEVTLATVLPEEIPEETYLCFRSGKQEMRFWVDGELRQEYNTDKTRIIGSYSPVAYIFVKIYPKDAGKELLMTAQTASSYNGIFYAVYQGSQMAVWNYYFRLYGLELIVATLVLMLSTLVIAASFLMQSYYHRVIDLKYLGWAVLIAGVWELANSAFRQLIFPNLPVINDIAFYMVMLLPMPFLLYMDGLQKRRYTALFRVLETITLGDFLLCTCLHVAKAVDFNETILLMAVVCLVVIIVLLVTIVIDALRGYAKEYRVVSWGIFCAFLCAIVQIATYFQRTKAFNGVILSIGLVFLMLFATLYTVQELVVTEREKHKALMASKFKGEFLANMSHEIRTPVNAVLGLGEMILRQSKEAQIREYAADIGNVGHTLLSLINDILDLSKIESGKMGIMALDYDLSSLIVDVANMIEGKAEAKGLRLELVVDEQLPCGLYGDDMRLRQILVNLLNNAVKYTDAGSVILEISGKQEEEGKMRVHFSVRDTGIGIREEDRDKLYEAFERIDEEHNRSVEGTGLGMSITVRLLALMDSHLDVQSEYGKGSEFSFELTQRITNQEPIGDIHKRLKERNEKYAYEASFVAPDAKVLLVDDNYMNRKVFRGLLNQTALQIEEAENGTGALEKLSGQEYDIIFLDYMMPDMNGIEVLQKLMQLSDNPNREKPVVALTANAISGARDMYLQAGFTDYLSKPIQSSKLEKMIQKYLPEEKWQKALLKPSSDMDSQTGEYGGEMLDLPEVEGIDWNFALQKVKDASLVRDLVKDFCLLAEGDLKELQSYYDGLGPDGEQEEMLKQFRVKVHGMKTSAAMLGALETSSLAKLLEYAAKEHNIKRIQSLFPTFAEEWMLLRSRLAKLLPEQDAGGGEREVMEVPELLQHLERLKDAMADMDVDMADEVMDRLMQYSYDAEIYGLLQQMHAAERSLDEQKVIGLVGEIERKAGQDG